MSFVCSICGKSFDNGFQDKSGNVYCSEKCFESTYPKCAVCGKPMTEWISTNDGRNFCNDDCYKKTLPKCSVCGNQVEKWYNDSNGNVFCSDRCHKKALPRCRVCGKSMQEWIRLSDGYIYCSQSCIDTTLPKCCVCGKPVDGGIEDSDGLVYCDDKCVTLSLPKCSVCGKRMRDWLENDKGTKFCSEACCDTTRPKCVVCGKPIRNGYQDSNGKCYCSINCFESLLPKCTVCGKPIYEGFRNSRGAFCSDRCYHSILPKCNICGKPVHEGYKDEHNHYYCSDACFNSSLPSCSCCGKKLTTWIDLGDGRIYCNNICFERSNYEKPKIDMNETLTADELAYITGLTSSECEIFMRANNITGDEALEAIDIFMQSLNDNIEVPANIAFCLNNAGIYSKMAKRLSQYNTMRGGVKGYGGFVFEEMHAASAGSKGVNINVIGNNGIADFLVKDPSGKEILVQAKAGYKPNQIDWTRYKGQTIIVDKGNTALANEARKVGLKVEESAIYKKQADIVARAQQWEGKIRGTNHAPITGTLTSMHGAGVASAKLAARVGVCFKIGENIYDVVSGEKDFAEAAADVVVDGAVIVGGAYLTSAAFTGVGIAATTLAETSAGAAVVGAISSTAGGSSVVAGVTTAAKIVSKVVSVVSGGISVPFVAAACVAAGFLTKKFRHI